MVCIELKLINMCELSCKIFACWGGKSLMNQSNIDYIDISLFTIHLWTNLPYMYRYWSRTGWTWWLPYSKCSLNDWEVIFNIILITLIITIIIIYVNFPWLGIQNREESSYTEPAYRDHKEKPSSNKIPIWARDLVYVPANITTGSRVLVVLSFSWKWQARVEPDDFGDGHMEIWNFPSNLLIAK